MGFTVAQRKGDRVETGWFERLTAVMAAMAGGDTTALEELYLGFGDQIRTAIRREFRLLGVARIDPADVDGLALDVCTDLFHRAGSWDPAHGATPWRWARRRVQALVVAHVGQFADPLPEGGLAEEPALAPALSGAGDEDVLSAFDRLAARHADVRLVHEALDRVSRRAQQEILFEVRMQAGQGDPSPAVTVGRVKNMRPDAVRQTCKRLVDRVNQLVASDPYFAPLAGLPLFHRAA